jgi:abortive infection bacteriophage resistance protein
MDKIFKTHNQQLKILRNRGLTIKNGSKAKRILEKENYYNLINGYKDLFIDTTYTNREKYKTGANFFEIYALYKFDKKIRQLFLEKILTVENNIKSAIAYVFSAEYGHDNYLKISNFELQDNHNLSKASQLIAHIQNDIARQINRSNSITHYMENYGYVPLWVLVNILTFGTISRFFSLLKLKERQNVGKMFNVPEGQLNSYLRILSLYRNSCAHDERLYNLKARVYISDNNVHSALIIPRKKGCYICGKNDVFALLICLKVLLEKKDYKALFSALRKEIYNLAKELNTITIDDVYLKMGFPQNWEDIKNI